MATETTITRPTFRTPEYCSRCGSKLEQGSSDFTRWICPHGHITYCNPVPVGVGVIPTQDDGYVLIRRNIEPEKGKLAFPGGNIGSNESVLSGIVREVSEEIGLATEINLWRPHSFVSTPDNQKVLMFAVYEDPIDPLFPWQFVDGEVSEVVVVNYLPNDMAFPLHADVLRRLLFE